MLGASLLLSVTAVAIAFTAGAVFATEAAPNVIKEITQPDGTVVKVRLWGDEFAHGWETLDGYTVVLDKHDKTWKYARRDAKGNLVPSTTEVGKAKPKGHEARSGRRPRRSTRPAPRWARRRSGRRQPTRRRRGPARTPTCSTSWSQFTDTACTFTPTQMQANLFGNTASGPGNLADFFDEVSRGALQLDGTVVGNAAGTGCAVLGNTHAFYDTGGGSAAGLVTEAVGLVDGYVDFSQYDNDGDGTVDALGIIYAGGGPHDGCDDRRRRRRLRRRQPLAAFVLDGRRRPATASTSAPYIINSEITSVVAHRQLHGDPDDRPVRPRVRPFPRPARPVRHGRQHAGRRRLLEHDGVAVPQHGQPGRHAAALRPVEQVVPRLGDAHRLHRPERLACRSTGSRTTGRSPSSSPNPGGAEIGGSGEYFLVENRQLTGVRQRPPRLRDPRLAHRRGEGRQPGGCPDGRPRTGSSRSSRRTAPADIDGPTNAGNRGDTGDPFPGSTNNQPLRRHDDAVGEPLLATPRPASGSRSSAPAARRACSSTSGCRSPISRSSRATIRIRSSPATTLEYTITVVNNGPGNVADGDGHGRPAGRCHVPRAAPSRARTPRARSPARSGRCSNGASKNFQIQVGIPANFLSSIPASTTNISNTASVSADQPDGNLINNSVTISTAVVQSADLRVTKVCEPAGGTPAGGEATCSIYVDNLGPSAAQGVVLTDALTGNAAVLGRVGQCQPGWFLPGRLRAHLGHTRRATSGPSRPAAGPRSPSSSPRANPVTINDVASVTSSTPDPSGRQQPRERRRDVRRRGRSQRDQVRLARIRSWPGPT